MGVWKVRVGWIMIMVFGMLVVLSMVCCMVMVFGRVLMVVVIVVVLWLVCLMVRDVW